MHAELETMTYRPSRRLHTSPGAPATRPGRPPRVALVVGASHHVLDTCHRSAKKVGAVALDSDVSSAWLTAFACSPFAVLATEAAFVIDGEGLRAIADATGARLLRLEDLLPDEGTLDAALRLALDRWQGPRGSVPLARVIPMGFG